MGYQCNGPPPTRQPTVVGSPTRRLAFTLAELLIVLVIIAVLLGLASLRIGTAADRSAVRSAASEAAAVFTAARNAAIYRREAVAVTIDTVRGTVRASSDTVLLYRRDLWATMGVRLTV